MTVFLKKRFVFTLLLVLVITKVNAQNVRKAESYFSSYEYGNAIPVYEKILQKKQDTVILIHLAHAYRMTHDYIKAEQAYAKLTGMFPDNPDYHFAYAKLLKMNGKNKEAKEQFTIYNDIIPIDPEGMEELESFKLIEKEDSTDWVEVKNCKALNTDYSEFSPEIFNKGIIFTSDRKHSQRDKKFSGWTHKPYLSLYYADMQVTDSIHISNITRLPKGVNNKYHNGISSSNSDGSLLYFCRVDHLYSEDTNFVNRSKIYSVEFKNNKWGKVSAFQYNSDVYDVSHPYISADGNQLFFASNMENGYGGKDIYVCQKKGDKWSEPENLGSEVNTFGDEVFPYLKDSTTLYFSSNGRAGYGGLDIFVSLKYNGVWSLVSNIKKPFNSSDDDFGMHYIDKKMGFFSSDRMGGKGSDDIFEFNLDIKKIVSGITMIAKKDSFDFSSVKAIVIDAPIKLIERPLELPTNIGSVKQSPELYYIEMERERFVLDSLREKRLIETSVEEEIIDTSMSLSLPIKRTAKPFIPDELPKSIEMTGDTVFFESIFYDFNKHNILDVYQGVLVKVLETLKNKPNTILQITSHTDSRGSNTINMKVSKMRCNEVRYFFIINGIPSTRISTIAKGESELTNECKDGVECTEEGHAKNRRSDMIVLPKKGFKP